MCAVYTGSGLGNLTEVGHAIGEYIADSIRYLAFGIRTSIIDSNVVRILGRIYGIKITPESRRDPRFRKLIDGLLPRKKFREFNLALLDHGAMICVRKPKCEICPITGYCTCYKGLVNL